MSEDNPLSPILTSQEKSREGARSPDADTDRPTSFAQQRLWFLDQLEPGNPAYNEQVVVCLEGPLDVPALEASLTEIVRRHETLRTSFVTIGEESRQIVSPPRTVRLTQVSLQQWPENERDAEALRLAAEEAGRPFDLARGPLYRTVLLALEERRYVLVLTLHHIITDGWSAGVLLRELSLLYGAFSAGKPSPLSELPIQYGDFAKWQREWLEGEVLESLLSYWKRQLGGNLPVFSLPTDRPRPKVQTFRGARHSVLLPRKTADALRSLGLDEGTTLYMTLLAAFQTLIFRLTGQEDVLVGTDIANRRYAETEALIGFFVNLLVLRTDLSGNPPFRELLSRVREVALGAYAHQDLPFEKLVEELRPERDLSRNPLVQVLFVMLNLPKSEVSLSGIRGTRLDPGTDVARFDLAVFITESEEGLLANWVYNVDLFEASTITAMSERYCRLLESIAENPDSRLESLEIDSEAARHRLREASLERRDSQSARLRSIRRRGIDLSGEFVDQEKVPR